MAVIQRVRRAMMRRPCDHRGHAWWGLHRVRVGAAREGDIRTCLHCGRQQQLVINDGTEMWDHA